MTTLDPSDSLAEELGARWNRFWFTPAEALPASLLRIVIGLIAAVNLVDCGLALHTWYAADGVLPPAAVNQLLVLTNEGEANFHVSYLSRITNSGALWVVHSLAIVAALAFAVGLFTRASGIITLVATLAYVHRVPQVAGHVEPVLSFLIAYLCIAPSGAWLSLDRKLFGAAKKQSPLCLLTGPASPSISANIGLRLIQVHLAMFYAMMGLSKLYGDAWWDGNGVWLLLAQTESRPLNLTGLRSLGAIGEYLLNFWSHLIVYFELAFGILIWTRIGRPILLWLSILIWLSIIIVTGQLLFGLAMLAAGLAFVPAEYLRGLVKQPAALPAESPTTLAA